MQVGLYTKAIIGAVVALLMSLITALDDGNVTAVEWVTSFAALLVAAGAIWAIPNTPKILASYGKSITAGLLGGLAVLVTALTDGGVSQSEILQIVVALVSGAGLVAIAPNAAASDGMDV